MRSALSILGLVIVLGIVMFSAKRQMQAIKPPESASAASSASAADAGLPRPEAVGQQVQDLMKQSERRASDAE